MPPGERLGVGEQRRAGAGRVVVEVEGDRAGRVVAAGDRGLVGDRLPTVALAGMAGWCDGRNESRCDDHRFCWRCRW